MLKRLVEDIVMAVTFMTRLPLPARAHGGDRRLADAFWALPLAGLLVGGLSGATLLICLFAGLGEPLAAALALATLALTTGALHDDGLADFWDGIGGGRSPEQRLEIMRDSHIGTYGVLALVVTYLVMFATLTGLASAPGALDAAFLIATTAALARAAICIPLATLQPARGDGLADHFGRPTSGNLAIGLLWPTLLGAVLLGPAVLAVLAGALAAAATSSALARSYLGGYTGDVLGAVIMTAFAGGLIGARLVV